MSTRVQQRLASALSEPGAADRFAQQKYGLSAADAEQTLRAQIALARGRMPEKEQIDWCARVAKERYGWDRGRTVSELKRVAEMPTPTARIYAYLAAGGQNRVDEGLVRHVEELVQNAARADMELSLGSKMAESDKRTEKMSGGFEFSKENNQRVKEHADQRRNLRESLAAQLGVGEAKTYDEYARRVQKARSALADKIEAQESREMIARANGKEPEPQSMRDQLAMAYDTEKIRQASIDIGMGDFGADADRVLADSPHLVDESHDITEDL